MYYISDICSLCLQHDQHLKNTSSQDIDGTVIEKKLRVILLELIHFRPNVQKYICADCLREVSYIYKFRLKCLENMKILNDYPEKPDGPNGNIPVLQFDIKTKKEYIFEPGDQYDSEKCVREIRKNEAMTRNGIEVDEKKSPENSVEIKVEIGQENIPTDSSQLESQNRSEENSPESNNAVESVFIKEEPIFDTNSAEDPLPMETNDTITTYENFREFNEEKHIIDENITNSSDEYLPSSALCSTTYGSDNNEVVAIIGSNIIQTEEMWTSPDLESDKTTSHLPEKSREKYEAVYKAFLDWQVRKNVNSCSENVFLAYFGELSEKYKSSTLWAHYSMLRCTLLSKNNGINIENYKKLRAFLKSKAEGYKSKKAKTFTPQEINRFINEAPDSIYLATKVAFIMGIMGACRAYELNSLTMADIYDLGTSILVTVRTTKTKIVRKFSITGHYYDICKKYADLRPAKVTTSSFFLNYRNGKCTVQKIGINKFGSMGKQVASFLRLPNPELYTGHSFRRSSATILVETGGDITALKRHGGGWKSISVAKEYINPIPSNMNAEEIILNSVQSRIQQTNDNVTNFDLTPGVNVVNLSNIRYLPTINIVNSNNK